MRSANSPLYVILRLRTRVYAGPAAWKSLPAEIRDDADLPAFGNKQKTYFLSICLFNICSIAVADQGVDKSTLNSYEVKLCACSSIGN